MHVYVSRVNGIYMYGIHLYSPLNPGQLVDHPQLGEGHESTPHQESGDSRTKHSKDNDGTKILEEITLQRRSIDQCRHYGAKG